MKRSFRALGLVVLIVILVVMVGLGLLTGPTSPILWIGVLGLALIPLVHNRSVRRRFVEWDDSYSVGIAVIDEDHKRLLHLINNLQTAVYYHTSVEFERKALDEVIDYTRTHFGREEGLMKEYEFPGYEAHKAEHEAMIVRVGEFVHQYEQDREGTVEGLVSFLRSWLVNHITGTDRQYTAFLNGRGVY